MKKFIKHVTCDVIIWCAMLLTAFGNEPFKTYATNGLSFWFALVFFLSVVVLLVGAKFGEKLVESGEYKSRCNYHCNYAVISTIAEVIFAASMGWFWFATVMVVNSFAAGYYRHHAEKALSESIATTE